MRLIVLLTLVRASVSLSWKCNQTETLCAPFGCGEVCTDVWVDPIYTKRVSALYEKNLRSNRSLLQVSSLATHNSAIAKSQGFGLVDAYLQRFTSSPVRLENQIYSLSTQLHRFGVTSFEIDVHYLVGKDALMVCHAGGIRLETLNKLLRVLGIDLDSETIGCSRKDPLFSDELKNVRSAVRRFPSRLFVMYLDDQEDLHEWGKVDLLCQTLRDEVGSFLWSGPDPLETSIASILDSGRNLIAVSRTKYAECPFLYARDDLPWVEGGPSADLPCRSFFGSPLTRRTEDSTEYGPFYSGPKRGVINESRDSACSVNWIGFDQATPGSFEPLV